MPYRALVWKSLTEPTLVEKGGPGSGNFGHTGRPGHRGGSAGAPMGKRELLNSPGTNPEVDEHTARVLDDYKNSTTGALMINEKLRSGGRSVMADTVAEAIDATSLPQATTVYRGTDEALFPQKSQVGKLLSDKAFVSTSLKQEIAEEYNAGVMMEIRLPKGSKALNMDRWAEGEGMGSTKEYELLLQRGSKFRVLEDHIVQWETRHMVVELIP